MKQELKSKEQSCTIQKVQRRNVAGIEDHRPQSFIFEDHSLHSSILSETLEENQVHIQPITESLPVNELAQLISGLDGRSNQANQSIIEALANGRATNEGRYIQLKTPVLSHHSGVAIANEIAMMKPKETDVRISGNQYEVKASLNPWIKVAGGRITALDEKTHHKSPNPGWEFHSWTELTAAGINRLQPIVGQAFPGTTSSYTPSATYNPAAQVPAFHSLPPTSLPAVPSGYSWTGGGAPTAPYIFL